MRFPPVSSNPAAAAAGDEVLFERYALNGNASDFETLVRRYQDLAYRLALSVCGNGALAEEAVQEAFLRLPRYGKTFENRGAGSFRRWFYPFVLHVAQDCSRSERRIRLRERNLRNQEKSLAYQPAVALRAEQEAHMRALGDAVLALSVELRVPIVLHFLEGLSQTEIGKVLRINQSQVSRRLSQGLDLLRKHLTTAGVSFSVTALPGMLKGHPDFQVPAGLGERIMAGMEVALRASQRVAVYKAAPAVKAWALVAVCVLTASAFAAWAIMHSIPANPPSTAPEPKSPIVVAEKPPAFERVASRPYTFSLPWRWEFKNGIPSELKPSHGVWTWQSDPPFHGPCALAGDTNADGAIIVLPFEWPAQPSVLRFKLWLPKARDNRFGAYYIQGDLKFFPLKAWDQDKSEPARNLKQLTRLRDGTIYFVDRYLVACLDNNPFLVCEYERPYISDKIAIALKTWCVTEISAETLDELDLPEFLRDIPTATRAMGVEPVFFDELGRDIGIPLERRP